jgi:hypothetical protein
MLRILSIVSSINCIKKKSFEIYDELCIKTFVDKSFKKDLENIEFFVLSISENNYDTRSLTTN